MELCVGTLVTLPPPSKAIGLVVQKLDHSGLEVLVQDGSRCPISEFLTPWIETQETADPIGVFQRHSLSITFALMTRIIKQDQQITELQAKLELAMAGLRDLRKGCGPVIGR